MRITILTLGTRGDVQPCIALALGLTAAGYQVTLGADQEFEDAIKSRNIQYAPLRLNLRDFFNSADGRAVMNGTDRRPKKERREKSERWFSRCLMIAGLQLKELMR